MKASTTALLASTLALIIALPAQAKPHGDSLRERLDRQQTAIDRGVDSGALTRREADILRTEQREIRDLARSLRDERHPARKSQRLLGSKLDRAERHIRRLASNDEVRQSGKRHGRSQGRGDIYAQGGTHGAPKPR
ncbi:hypothetical protein G3480_21775 [Thiorhodococcus mannitoliphagus]|uniref:Uncharacterized protein n=1 Tax=Thiorhodococcus mannitoliphagus TaxID=329406 RepID=A0A6P1DXI4_9GAMM|nr:hypothetical protein [Thiorhodococcus mannitoliphagus]NEX22898.1 hypothetical protein [Thiorhodococcus mannitoliphagus]